MATFVQIGDEVINLDQVVRVVRATVSGGESRVVVYFADDNEGTQAHFVGGQAEAVWRRFAGSAEKWEVPDAPHGAPAGPGRTAEHPA